MGLIEVLHAEIADTEAAIAQLQQESLGHADLLASFPDQVTPSVANADSQRMLRRPSFVQGVPLPVVPCAVCLRPVIRMCPAGTDFGMHHLSLYCACAGLNHILRACLCSPHVHV